MTKYWTIFHVFLQDSITYRSQAVLWMLTDITPAIIMPFVWLAGFNGRTNIAGFGPSQIVIYYLAMTMLSNLVVAHVQWEISFAVKQGDLSKFLLYPFSYIRYQYLGNIAWRLMRCTLFIPFAVLWLVIFRHEVNADTVMHIHAGLPFLVTLVLGHFVAFLSSWALGMLSFYFVETQALYAVEYALLAIFSGQLAPYAMLPHALKIVSTYTPFRYTLSLPLEVLLGSVHGADVWRGAGVQLIWLVLLGALGRIGWQRGTRRYAGAGM